MSVDKTVEEVSRAGYGCGVRHLQVGVMCACVTALIVVRSSMGVAVLAMTDHARGNDTRVTIYDWDKKTQGLILSSFFWGYLVMQIPASLMTKRFGGKLTILVALLANAALNLLLPTLASLGGWVVVCAARAGMGLTQACLFPAVHALLGRWLPAHERTALAGVVFGGTQIGTIISMSACGALADTSMGWPLIYYSMGALLLASAVLWVTLAASSPAEHRLLPRSEQEYIERSGDTATLSSASLPTPWRHILTSVPVWAIVIAHSGSIAGFILLFVDMPTYLEKALGISLRSSATLSALPYVGMWLGTMVATMACEKLQNSGLLSVAASRRLLNSIGFFGMALGLVWLAFLGPENKNLAVCALVGSLTMFGVCMAGFMVNHLDISPNFAGLLLAITNFAANIVSVLTPIATTLILRNDPHDLSRWRVVFLLVAGVAGVSNVLYVVLSRFDTQPWDDPRLHRAVLDDADELKPVIGKSEKYQPAQHTVEQSNASRATPRAPPAAPPAAPQLMVPASQGRAPAIASE